MRFLYCLLAMYTGFSGAIMAQRVPKQLVASVRPVPVAEAKAAVVTAAPAPTATLAFKPDSIFVNPDVRPQFTGSEAGLRAYLMKNLRYPDQALRQHVSGKVYVRFILSATGRVTDASVVRGPGSGLNEEALRLVWMMPSWQPARQRGQPVRVSCTLPITFQE
jgi:protein TonB